jgi:hypothetical protein
MALRDRIRRLSRDNEDEKWELRCPVCGWETTIYGDVHVDLIVLDWHKYQWEHGVKGYRDPKEAYHPSLVELAEHEHDEEFDFVEKRSGLNLYNPAVSGMNLGGTPADPL